MFENDDELNALVDEGDLSEEEMVYLAHAFLREKKLLPKFREYVRAEIYKKAEGEDEESEEEDDDLDDLNEDDEEDGDASDEE